MASSLCFRFRPFSFLEADVCRAISIPKSSRIVPSAYFSRYSSDRAMASTHSESAEDSESLSCSLEVHNSSEQSRSPCRREEWDRVDGGKSAASNPPHPAMQKIIWGSGNPNFGTGSNPPIEWPQNLTHRVPNIADLVAVDASSIVEPVLEDENNPQDGQHHPSTSLQDGQPSKRSAKKAAKNEARKATRKAAKQRSSGNQPPVREPRAHEDGLPTCLSSSSDDDLIPGQPPPLNRAVNTTPEQSCDPDRLRSSTNLETDQRFSKIHPPLVSTQARSGNVGELLAHTEKAPVMDSSKPAAPPEPTMADDTQLTPASQNYNSSQPQQKKEKKSKPSKHPPAPTTLPLSPALIDLRVGHILRCIPHENADSLYVSTIAMGDPEGSENTHKDEETGRIVRTVCSGLRGLIPIEQMQDRKVIVMTNLKPVTMRGIKSAAMVLAASPLPKEGEDPHSADRAVELVSPPEGSEGGDRAFFEGWDYGEGKGPEKVLNPKKKQWEGVQPGLYTSEELTVVFDAGRVQGVEGGKGELVVEGDKGRCKVLSLKGARLS
jgi:tRNA-binding EMAP/Myf-like protein